MAPSWMVAASRWSWPGRATLAAPATVNASGAGLAAGANADYSRIRILRRAPPLTLSLPPGGGEGIELAPSPRERVGVRVRVCSRIIRAKRRADPEDA